MGRLCEDIDLLRNNIRLIYDSVFFVVMTLCVLQVKGLVKQHIDSFNYFINVEVKHSAQAFLSVTAF